ncbi:hypothetical protein CICLE_v10030091mg [Citrus x clementina]|uniref:Uncharacterized protein n=1 Tax=Citrus clementina TaxID=85681 RepID=V4SA65_CITCL|nr:hypothetical protein CICLE_v10030091mg [Citrus x clementina]
MGFVKKHVAVEMEDSKSSDEDADIKKGEILKSVSDSDEDNFVEYVEFNEVQHRRRAIFGYGVDSGDQKDSYEEGEDDDSDEGADDDNDTVDNQLSSACIPEISINIRNCPKKCTIVARVKKMMMMNFLSRRSKEISYGDLKSWKQEEAYESIRDRFVMGDWSKAAQKNQVSKGKSEDDDSDDAVYGDYEDLETCEKHEGQCEDNSGSEGIENEDESAVEEWRLKKLTLRAKFDAQYPFSFD